MLKNILYWSRKVGMLRTSSYIARNAEELNRAVASDGKAIQSQAEIRKRYKESNSKNNNDIKSEKGGALLFWVFAIVGAVLLIMILLFGFSFPFFVDAVLWCVFLWWMRRNIFMRSTAVVVSIGIVLVFVSVGALIIVSSDSEQNNGEIAIDSDIINNTSPSNENNLIDAEDKKPKNKISQFLTILGEDIGIEFEVKEEDVDVIWTNGGAGLGLSAGREILVKNSSLKTWNKINKYFQKQGGTTGTYGMEFVSNSANKQSGYYFTKEGNEYYMLMCVLTKMSSNIKIGCGWGPGGGE